ncbi:MAG: cytochrome c oxidase subunit II [Alphaproteobacteria bacterium]|jgi:cytochrome c oxidase subunit 2|nr:cytochrome c oxidase subunit II [Alphaproteobacteria bacterium]
MSLTPRSWRNTKIAAAAAALWAAAGTAALALPQNYEIGFQPANSPVMEQIESFHLELLYIITAVCLFVLALLVYIVIKFRAGANPTPSKVHHNTLLEVAWTIIPVIILVVIAVPSFRLLYFESAIPKPDVVIKAIGKQWFWTYEYPGANAGFTYDSLGLSDADAAKAGKPRLLGTDNEVVVPVGKVIEIETTGADVIHSWALPEMGVKMDAVPGRINHTWFKAERTGVYYGQCSELCGARHAYMPIEVHVVTDAEYAEWLASAKKKFAALDTNVQVAAK